MHVMLELIDGGEIELAISVPRRQRAARDRRRWSRTCSDPFSLSRRLLPSAAEIAIVSH
jgi:hypothetical protein